MIRLESEQITNTTDKNPQKGRILSESLRCRWRQATLIGGFGFLSTVIALLPGVAQAGGEQSRQYLQCGGTVGLEVKNPGHTYLVTEYRGVNSEGATYTRYSDPLDLGDLHQCPARPSTSLNQETEDQITLVTSCSEAHFYGNRYLNQHIDLYVRGNLDTGPLGIWYLLRDIGGREKVIPIYEGEHSRATGGVFHGEVGNIRGGKGEPLSLRLRPFHWYRVEIYQAQYTNNRPNLNRDNLMAQRTFQTPQCVLK